MPLGIFVWHVTQVMHEWFCFSSLMIRFTLVIFLVIFLENNLLKHWCIYFTCDGFSEYFCFFHMISWIFFLFFLISRLARCYRDQISGVIDKKKSYMQVRPGPVYKQRNQPLRTSKILQKSLVLYKAL